MALSFFIVISACSPKSQYDLLVEKELSKRERHDDLFMGLKFGQRDKDFYEYCREKNRQGTFMQGVMNGGIAVQCRIDELTYPATMDFYPQFDNEKISGIRAKIKYNAWAPWNRHLFADHLILDLMQLFKKWYGKNDFIESNINGKEKHWIKIDGNRQIDLKKEDDLFVSIQFTDIYLQKKEK